MSSVLQVWAQPANTPLPRDGFEADAQRLQLRQSGELGPLAFLSLLRLLDERLPARDGDPLWTPPLAGLTTQEPVLELGLQAASPRYEAALAFATVQANALGLHLADSLSGAVHLADGSVIGETDEVLVYTAPDAPAVKPVAPPPEWELADKISVFSDLPESPAEAPAQGAALPTLQPIPELTLAVDPDAVQEPPALAALRRGAEAGDTRAARELGLALQSGRLGVQDAAQAVQWFERAADAGDALAAAALGACLLDGQGTGRDTTRARHWLERAQGSRDAAAQFQLGRMLVAGWGGPAEPERGVRLYLQAATQGHADAIFNLASCLDAGFGCEPDRLAAKALFLRARALGSPLRAAGLRVKQREIEAVRALAHRFETPRDIPALLEERRVERGLQLALARRAHEDVQEVRQAAPETKLGGLLGTVTQWVRAARGHSGQG